MLAMGESSKWSSCGWPSHGVKFHLGFPRARGQPGFVAMPGSPPLPSGECRVPPIRSASRNLLIFLGVGACLIGSAVAANAGQRVDDGLAPARVLTSAERAQLESKAPADVTEWLYQNMSAMGAAAAGIRRPADPDFHPSFHLARTAQRFTVGGTDVAVVSVPAVGTQSETAIASNPAGTILVAGYNDARGFPDPS